MARLRVWRKLKAVKRAAVLERHGNTGAVRAPKIDPPGRELRLPVQFQNTRLGIAQPFGIGRKDGLAFKAARPA